jgi:PAS domain S-box-containing protein
MQNALDESLIVLETVPEAYIRLDGEFRFTFLNRAAEALLGKTRDRLLGTAVSDAYPASLGISIQENCRRAMAERSTVKLERYLEPWRRWYVITAIPDSSDGAGVQFSDITYRRLIEDELLKSKEKFSKVFQSSPAPMCDNACFLEVNDAFERITGYRRDETIGRTSTEWAI